ncbi:hypothetical protein OKJ48_22230 [Streptomyces kunmingensis]|uniref:Uncharacterized protein n=1 Tax=Streptomyces kunmingensis TaxID=68225 RepID=A0ABU6CE14_9ACTN|nr:hypothetical protein [Streptomyces kunmingensis]MEB3962947.1 hypothetical protein [Streptomyces kunmingensis]
MRRTTSWPASAVAAVVLTLAVAPVCAPAWADQDDTRATWESTIPDSTIPDSATGDGAETDIPDADSSAGDSPEGGIPEGGIPEGDIPEGDIPEGDSPVEDSPEGDDYLPGEDPAESSSDTLELVPADARPGSTVTANTSACGEDERATGDADSLGAGDFPLRTGTHQGDVVGRFQVPSAARPGTYPISVSCESGTVARQLLTVSGRGGTELHGVHAGDGGSLGRFSTVQLVLGATLIAGSAGAAAYYVRRRAREQ